MNDNITNNQNINTVPKEPVITESELGDRRTWEEFKATKLLWWVNRTLHLFGWCIALVEDCNDNYRVVDCFPVKTNYRGFNAENEAKNFKILTEYLAKESPTMLDAFKSEDNDVDSK